MTRGIKKRRRNTTKMGGTPAEVADRVHWQDVGDFALDAEFDDLDGAEEEIREQFKGIKSDD